MSSPLRSNKDSQTPRFVPFHSARLRERRSNRSARLTRSVALRSTSQTRGDWHNTTPLDSTSPSLAALRLGHVQSPELCLTYAQKPAVSPQRSPCALRTTATSSASAHTSESSSLMRPREKLFCSVHACHEETGRRYDALKLRVWASALRTLLRHKKHCAENPLRKTHRIGGTRETHRCEPDLSHNIALCHAGKRLVTLTAKRRSPHGVAVRAPIRFAFFTPRSHSAAEAVRRGR